LEYSGEASELILFPKLMGIPGRQVTTDTYYERGEPEVNAACQCTRYRCLLLGFGNDGALMDDTLKCTLAD